MAAATSLCAGRIPPHALLLGTCLTWFATSTVAAQAVEAHADPGVVVGAKAGGGVGAPFNDFGLSYVAELELGYLLPLPAPVAHALQLFAAGAYSAPSLDGRLSSRDRRLPGNGRAQYTIDQKVLAITFGVLGRIPLHSELIAPYLALGYRGTMTSSTTRGSVAGEAFGTNTEQGYAHGIYAAVGVDFFLGPGAVLAELQLTYAERDVFVLRNTNVGALQFMLGYRLMFGSAATPASTVQPPVRGSQATDADKAAADARARQAAATTEAAPDAVDSAAQAAETQASPTGQIRGNVRTLKGAPLEATVTVEPEGLRAVTNADGTFSVQVSPGRHEVRLRAPGYVTQSREVMVDEDGITVLNVELRTR